MVHRSHGSWHAVIALILEWVLVECESMGPRVIPLAHFPRRYSSFMCGQAKGRSEYVSPKEYSSGSYELGIHFATGPAWLGSHWPYLLGAFSGVIHWTPTGAPMTLRRGWDGRRDVWRNSWLHTPVAFTHLTGLKEVLNGHFKPFRTIRSIRNGFGVQFSSSLIPVMSKISKLRPVFNPICNIGIDNYKKYEKSKFLGMVRDALGGIGGSSLSNFKGFSKKTKKLNFQKLKIVQNRFKMS